MRLIARILNPVADEFFSAGVFRLNLFSLVFWGIVVSGPMLGFVHGRDVSGMSGGVTWAVVGLVCGIGAAYLFLAMCYRTFHFLLRIGWIVHPKDRNDKNTA